MAVVKVAVTEAGVQLPEEAPRELGLRPGEEVRLEIRRLPDVRAIQSAAKYCAWRKLGDAVGVGDPVWDGAAWAAPLRVRERDGVFGYL